MLSNELISNMHYNELFDAIKFIKSNSNLPTFSFLFYSSLFGAKNDKLYFLSPLFKSFSFYKATYFSDSDISNLNYKSFMLLIFVFIIIYIT